MPATPRNSRAMLSSSLQRTSHTAIFIDVTSPSNHSSRADLVVSPKALDPMLLTKRLESTKNAERFDDRSPESGVNQVVISPSKFALTEKGYCCKLNIKLHLYTIN